MNQTHSGLLLVFGTLSDIAAKVFLAGGNEIQHTSNCVIITHFLWLAVLGVGIPLWGVPFSGFPLSFLEFSFTSLKFCKPNTAKISINISYGFLHVFAFCFHRHDQTTITKTTGTATTTATTSQASALR